MRIAIWGMLAVTTLAACGTEENATETTAGALGVTGMPQGLTCGMGYYTDYRNVQSGYCKGYSTANAYSMCSGNTCTSGFDLGPSAPGFHVAGDGDRGRGLSGAGLGWGFYHQSLSASTGGVTTANTDQLYLPKGTACGFKEACNGDSGETCMGYDSNHSCPPGWVQRVASDIKAPSGCGFVWCEYQDPNNLCIGDCQLTNQPSGIVCGIDDNDRHNGQCLGVQTDSACPAGWQHQGSYDYGRSPNHGVGWCTKI
jgi:hypothetical protein